MKAAGSAKIVLHVSLSGASSENGSPTSFSERGSGAFDFAHRRGTMSMTISGLPSTSAASGQATIRIVVDGPVIYEKLPPGALGEQAPKPWIKFDLSRTPLGALAGGDPSSADPTEALALLGATSPPTDVGRDTVRGVTCRHYRTTVDLAKVVSALPADTRDELAAVGKAFESRTFPVDVWIDDAGRLRKMTFTARLTPASVGASSGAAPTMTETVEYFDFGTPVRLSLPPAGQVTDISGLLATPTPTP